MQHAQEYIAITSVHKSEYQSTWAAFLTDSFCVEKRKCPKYPDYLNRALV